MDIYEASMMVWKRAPRFVEGFNPYQEINDIIFSFFGNNTKIHVEGLSKQYLELKKNIIENRTIGLVLLGREINENIIKYEKEDHNITQITVSSVCHTLINSYFTKEELEKECYKTPNIEIYLK